MTEESLWLAACLALVPAFMGNRTAWALLASLLYATALEWLQVPFGPEWMLADLFVLRAILSPVMSLQDELIAALFLVAWPGYFMDAETNYEIGMFVVVAQLLLTLPWVKLQRAIWNVTHGPLRAGSGEEAVDGGRV